MTASPVKCQVRAKAAITLDRDQLFTTGRKAELRNSIGFDRTNKI